MWKWCVATYARNRTNREATAPHAVMFECHASGHYPLMPFILNTAVRKAATLHSRFMP